MAGRVLQGCIRCREAPQGLDKDTVEQPSFLGMKEAGPQMTRSAWCRPVAKVEPKIYQELNISFKFDILIHDLGSK